MTTSAGWERLQWHGWAAWIHRRPDAEIVVADIGAKIASLRWRGREWLLQPRPARLDPPSPGDSYVDGALCGWDEMFPSITGTSSLDHGEVWSVPWDASASGPDVLTHSVTGSHSVSGLACSYTLRRSIEVTHEGCIDLSYDLTTTSTAPWSVLWAAHPQFLADDRARIVIEPAPQDVYGVDAPESPRRRDWPAEGAQLDTLGAPGSGTKFWVDPDRSCRSASLVRGDGDSLTITWDPDRLPYCGVWVDRGIYATEQAISLQPANAYFDDVDRAVRLGRVATVSATAPLDWSLRIAWA